MYPGSRKLRGWAFAIRAAGQLPRPRALLPAATLVLWENLKRERFPPLTDTGRRRRLGDRSGRLGAARRRAPGGHAAGRIPCAARGSAAARPRRTGPRADEAEQGGADPRDARR